MIASLDLNMTPGDIIKMIALVVTFLGVAWRLGKQLEAMLAQLESQTTLFTEKLSNMHTTIAHNAELVKERVQRITERVNRVEGDIVSTGQARKELWKEVNSTKDRTTALETLTKMRETGGK